MRIQLLGYFVGSSVVATLPLFSADQVGAAVGASALPELRVVSSRVANQEPVGTFAMPVSALTFEPLVDAQDRNMAEGQSDISIRGGTFENTGFSIGAVPIYDPQTGHYYAELPVAPAMLGAPIIRTGAENTEGGWSATAGSVAYGWAPVRAGGYLSAGGGENRLVRGDAYAGVVAERTLGKRTVAMDFNMAGSQGDGSRPFGDHRLERYNARLQFSDESSQTDVFVGYQAKRVGWRGLYAQPFTSNELDDLKTMLYALNHRVNFVVDGDYLEVGGYYRINKNHYEFNRAAPTYASVHETRVVGLGLQGRTSLTEATAMRYHAGVIADEIDSRALIVGPVNGRYDDRTQVYVGVFADQTIPVGDERSLVLTGGANFDDSNRASSAISPVASLTLKVNGAMLRQVYVSYAESTQLPSYTALNSRNNAGLFAGNRDLGRSTAQNFELGADALWGAWHTHAAVFFRRDRDLVDWTYSALSTSARTANAVDIDTLGFEVVGRRHWEHVDLVLGYTALTKDDNFGAGVDASFYALNYAEHRLTAAITARLGAGLELRMDNEFRIQADNTLRTRNDQPILSAFGLIYHVPGIAGLTLNAQVDNLWNTYYEEVPAVPGARRTWSAGATYLW